MRFGPVVRVPGYRFRGPGLDFRRYQIFWEVVGLERGPLSLVSTVELFGRNSSGSGLENREYGCGDPLRWPRDTLCPQKLALTSPTRCGHSVGIVLLRTKATEFVLFCLLDGDAVCVLGTKKELHPRHGLRCAFFWPHIVFIFVILCLFFEWGYI
jgi:hypothetical protein